MLHVDDLNSCSDLLPRHIARIVYAFSEIAVFGIRGESRQTDTGTPIGQKEELSALLKFSNELMPGMGFDKALTVYETTDGYLNCTDGREIYWIAAPMLRAIPKFASIMNNFHAPNVDEFKAMMA